MNLLLGMKILWIFSGLSQNWAIWGSFLCILWSFHKDKVHNWRYVLKFLIFILG